jgi:hypothetical protein
MNRETMSAADEMTYDDLLRFLGEHQERIVEKLRRAGMFEPYSRRWVLPARPEQLALPGARTPGMRAEVVVETRIRATRSIRRVDQ